MQPGKFSLMKAISPGVPNTEAPLSNMPATSGALVRSSRMMFCAVQMKMPEFQKNSPVSMNTSAISSFGFSVKVFTL